MAPEQTGEDYTNKVDVYAFGLILYEIVTGCEIFTGLTQQQIWRQASSGSRPEIPESVDPGVKALISLCWDASPDVRPSFADVVLRLKGMNYCIGHPCDEDMVL